LHLFPQFEHASHVTMSGKNYAAQANLGKGKRPCMTNKTLLQLLIALHAVVKMLSRVVAPDEVLSSGQDDEHTMQRNLHDHTYGITSDPLTQFAVVLSALVHDV
jgi:hypothetical protein